MFSGNFIQQAQKSMKKSKESSVVVVFGQTSFVISREPLRDESKNIFQGHVEEDDNLLFVYLKSE